MSYNRDSDAALDKPLSVYKQTGRSASAVERLVNWQPIETAPTTGRQKILLKTPHNQSGVLAYSNTWWTAGFSAECKPTHWAPAS